MVFVHGLWVTAASWAPFRRRWEAAGWTVHTPTWPGLEGLEAAEIRAAPPTSLGSLSVKAIVDGYEAFIQTLAAPPLILGHSFGGLFAQMLLDRGLGRAGIAVNPAPIAGVVPGWLTATAALPAIARPHGGRRPYTLDRANWAARYANTASPDVQKQTWDEFVIPTSGRVIQQAAFWSGTRIDPARRHQPLLITASDGDRLVTPYLSQAAFGIQRRAPGRTDFIRFPHLSHLLIAEPGWEMVADALIDWAGSLSSPPTAPSH